MIKDNSWCECETSVPAEPTKNKNYAVLEESRLTLSDNDGREVQISIEERLEEGEISLVFYTEKDSSFLVLKRKDLDRLGVAIMQFLCKNSNKSGG